MEYRVTWTIDVEADTPLDAAVKARGMQIRPNTTATVFEVQERRGHVRAEWAAPIVEVDLSVDYSHSLPPSDPRSEEYPAHLEGFAPGPCQCRCQEGRHCGGCEHAGCGY